jgi:hypothetical protein
LLILDRLDAKEGQSQNQGERQANQLSATLAGLREVDCKRHGEAAQD